MPTLSIDLETYSNCDLGKTGMHRYAEDDSFEILLFAVRLDDGPVNVYDLARGETLPPGLVRALRDPSYVKRAYNAAFEWTCLTKVFGHLPIDQWRCTMIHGLYCGLTAGLDATGKALGIPEDKRKKSIGRDLIRYFCQPCKPTKTNGRRTRNLPEHDPDKWELFKDYCRQDVEAESEIARRLAPWPVPDWVERQWQRDILLNARGVAVDMALVEGALELGAAETKRLTDAAVALSGLENPASVAQLTKWLGEETGETPADLRKATVAKLLSDGVQSAEAEQMLRIRQELGKTSNKKYNAIAAAVCADGRVRGLLQFYGASRTGRWAGRLVQVQNLPRTYLEPLDLARDAVKRRKPDVLRTVYGSIPDTLSQLIRTAFVAAPGKVLIDADFSAIEARVIAWLAGEEWRLEVFRTHGKIYEASASQMFGVPIEKIKKGNPEYELRQRGKVAELALGYQGGVSAMRAMDVGRQLEKLSDDEVKEIVTKWRQSNPAIINLWSRLEDAAAAAILDCTPQQVGPVTVRREYNRTADVDALTIELPSGRKLYYLSPGIGKNRWGRPSICYHGVDQQTKQWRQLETYGGKLVENVVQAIARDCLADAIDRLDAAGLPVVFHVHDEVVIEVDPQQNGATLEHVCKILRQPAPWAAGLPLNAEGWVGEYFKKD